MGVRKSLGEVAAGLAAMPVATRVMLRRWDDGLGELAAVMLLTRAAGFAHPATARTLAAMLARRTGMSVTSAADALRESILDGADAGSALVDVAMSRGLTLVEATRWVQDPETWA